MLEVKGNFKKTKTFAWNNMEFLKQSIPPLEMTRLSTSDTFIDNDKLAQKSLKNVCACACVGACVRACVHACVRACVLCDWEAVKRACKANARAV